MSSALADAPTRAAHSVKFVGNYRGGDIVADDQRDRGLNPPKVGGKPGGYPRLMPDMSLDVARQTGLIDDQTAQILKQAGMETLRKAWVGASNTHMAEIVSRAIQTLTTAYYKYAQTGSVPDGYHCENKKPLWVMAPA